MTEKRLDNVIFSIQEIGNTIQGFDPSKAHCQDNISIPMLKICGNSICKTLEIIYKECLSLSLLPLEWKKGNTVPVHKKGGKQCLEIYQPVFHLPVCGKILEKFIFDKIFQFFIKNTNCNKSVWFQAGRLLSTSYYQPHDIYKSFDEGYEVREVFLDISKTFDKIWHKGIIFN